MGFSSSPVQINWCCSSITISNNWLSAISISEFYIEEDDLFKDINNSACLLLPLDDAIRRTSPIEEREQIIYVFATFWSVLYRAWNSFPALYFIPILIDTECRTVSEQLFSISRIFERPKTIVQWSMGISFWGNVIAALVLYVFLRTWNGILYTTARRLQLLF